MKNFKSIGTVLLITVFSLTQTGCIGSFSLFNKTLDWNHQLGGKFINAGMFFLMWAFPVYEVILFIDAIILNTIEFWTGSNPIAMGPGESETEIVKGEDGKTYKITATQNRFDITDLDEGTDDFALVFDPEEKSWNYEDDERDLELVQFNEDESVTVFLPNGEEKVFSQEELASMSKDSFQSSLMTGYAMK